MRESFYIIQFCEGERSSSVVWMAASRGFASGGKVCFEEGLACVEKR